ncbi:hypothetical protein BCR34DRAFT_584451 [Clohesyomyces aquaticus]|uniref:Secreted protein n=1 Tax=Clohesyomyces aquaticus TaxID=1231657 RepID=A0A1Y2A129_9PLEO|nr:hypothetical protein BCR34DRAFT_584451 [Clohesyomyces aquaticus]
MQIPVFTVLGLLSFHIKAFEITIYNDINQCEANDESMYRIISGASNGTCYTFDDDMPGTDCSQYNKGEGEGPTGCTTESLLPVSVHQKNGNRPCTFYFEGGCQGTSYQTAEWCVDTGVVGIPHFGSFSCVVCPLS